MLKSELIERLEDLLRTDDAYIKILGHLIERDSVPWLLDDLSKIEENVEIYSSVDELVTEHTALQYDYYKGILEEREVPKHIIDALLRTYKVTIDDLNYNFVSEDYEWVY